MSQPGRVVVSHGRHYTVADDAGHLWRATTRGKKSGVVCGDSVEITPQDDENAVIERILPRNNLFYRSDAFKSKLIAANLDQIVIVVAPVPSFYPEFIDRCLIAAEAAGTASLIVYNKADLAAEAEAAWPRLAPYADLGYPIIRLSARQDISPLQPYLADKNSLFIGQSGMGKSSLLNALIPEAQAPTRDISAALDSGRHTTTHSQLYRLPLGGSIIDSPGMQEFGLGHLTLQEVQRAFIEFRPYLGQCRFHNCRHDKEPGCAILQAVQDGKIQSARLSTYHKLLKTYPV